jgi:hypothetical protein
MKNFKDAEQAIFDKYPKLFRQVTLPMSETCMCWGLECGTGWYSIIDSMCAELTEKYDGKIELSQIKEKHGILRVHFDIIDESVTHNEIHIVLIKYEKASYVTCEKCGTEGKIQNINGWIYTLCDEHAEEKKR